MTDSRKIRFRHDINRLRVLAVLSVVLFHSRAWSSRRASLGGRRRRFVIFGTLMATLMMDALESEKGEGALFLPFCFARVRCIVPALVVLVAVLLAIGWRTLSMAYYQQLATHGQYAQVFSSNHELFHDAGYFDLAAYEQMVLHTWSLVVETSGPETR